MNEYNQIIFSEPRWYRWVDGLVVLTLGITLGIIVAQTLSLTKVETTQRVIRSVPLRQDEAAESSETGVTPADTFRFEEI